MRRVQRRIETYTDRVGARSMPAQSYPSYHRRTLEYLYLERLGNCYTSAETLAWLTKLLSDEYPATPDSPASPCVDVEPPLSDGWRLVEYGSTIAVHFPDGSLRPGGAFWIFARTYFMWRGRRIRRVFAQKRGGRIMARGRVTIETAPSTEISWREENKIAIGLAAQKLREDSNATKREVLAFVRTAHSWRKPFAERRFEQHVWKEARRRAGLAERAPPGRRRER
jgi:hypothetical protein